MQCNCHDPRVFGHMCGGWISPWHASVPLPPNLRMKDGCRVLW
jgi:hypothetical protein